MLGGFARRSIFKYQNAIGGSCKQSTTAGKGKYVLGCGSNVVDYIYNVRVVPKAGEKGFFLSPFKALEAKLIGGVTLNHLCWAALGGVPTGLLCFMGNDEQGHFILNNLKKMGVTTDFIEVNDDFTTAQCHVFIQEDGERCIFMATAATSLIKAQEAKRCFKDPIQYSSSMVSTEISQVPFTGVLEVLKMAKEAGVLSILDLDIPPSVAINEAKLGEMNHLIQCLQMADILKPAKAAAEEVLHILGIKNSGDLKDIASLLMEKCGSKMVAVTDGAAGSIIATPNNVVCTSPPKVNKIVDTTGAGDAFLGGLIVGIDKYGLPQNATDIERLGNLANAFGATCVQSVGGVPTSISSDILQKYLPDHKFGFESSEGGTQFGEFTKSIERDSECASNLLSSYNSDVNENSRHRFLTAVGDCKGQVFTSGIGKSGHIAARLAATLSSIGIPSQYIHAAEWAHGDLGKLQAAKDVCIFISHSGNSGETIAAANQVIAKGVTTLAVTQHSESPLAKLSSGCLHYDINNLQEPFNCLPSSTLVLQDMLCNALVCELISRRGIRKQSFLNNHPGGDIGTKQH